MSHTLIFYEAPHKIKQTLCDMEKHLGSDRACALCRELTKLHEEVIRGTLGELSHYYDNTEPRGEYVIVIEGAHEDTSSQGMTAEQAAELARQMMLGGEKMSEACKKAAKAAGLSKQEVYKLVLETE